MAGPIGGQEAGPSSAQVVQTASAQPGQLGEQPVQPTVRQAEGVKQAVEQEGKDSKIEKKVVDVELRETTTAVAGLANELQTISPDAMRIGLSLIASGGDSPQAYIVRAQSLRKETKSAPTEGEGVLTEEQKQGRLAFSYDLEIEGVRMKLVETKKPQEKKLLADQLKKLQEERKKIDLPNQINDFASLFAINPEFSKYIAAHLKDGGYPLAAVKGILREAVTNQGVRTALIDHFRQLGIFSDEQIGGLERYFDQMTKKEKLRKGAVLARNVGLGALLMTILMAYMGSKEKKQGMGG